MPAMPRAAAPSLSNQSIDDSPKSASNGKRFLAQAAGLFDRVVHRRVVLTLHYPSSASAKTANSETLTPGAFSSFATRACVSAPAEAETPSDKPSGILS